MQSRKLTLACIVVLWMMALLTYEMVNNERAEVAGRKHETPQIFIDLCRTAVNSGLVALGMTGAASVAALIRTKKKKKTED